jgi:hypothetical protein
MFKPHRSYVSAGRLAALYDEHRYWTKRMLWEYVAHGRQPEFGDNPRARSGQMLEAGVLQMAAEDLGCEVIHLPQERSAFVQHSTVPIGCLADGLVMHPERGVGIVSAKCVSWQAWAKNWVPMKNGVPRDYELQLQAELLTLADNKQFIDEYGVPKWGCVAALNDMDVHLFEREVEAELHERIASDLDAFMVSVRKQDAPPLQYNVEELALIAELYPWNEDKYSLIDLELEDGERFVENAELLQSASARKKAAEGDIGEAKANILELSNGNTLVRTVGWQCKVNRIHVKASTCKNCGAETRRASDQVRYTVKEL